MGPGDEPDGTPCCTATSQSHTLTHTHCPLKWLSAPGWRSPKPCTLTSPLQVVAVGPGKKKDEDSEEIVKPNVTVGATVMYSKYSGTEFEVQ